MNFRTSLEPPRIASGKLIHEEGVMLLGSCFSDEIGARLRRALFGIDINPFGTTFNPMSIAASLDRIIDGTPFTDDDVWLHNGVWCSFMHHSSFALSDRERTLELLNRRLAEAREHLTDAMTLILTWGTAFVFEEKATGKVVNNCHRLPAATFHRRMVTADEITARYAALVGRLRQFNPGINIIVTVSPVRHLGDGLEGNSLSKAMLRVAAGELKELTRGIVDYFPAYEAVIDDLRDYRFYAPDMLHVSSVGADYIYQLFLDWHASATTRQAAEECERLTRRLDHRPMTENADAIDAFRRATADVIDQLCARYPYLQPRITKYQTTR